MDGNFSRQHIFNLEDICRSLPRVVKIEHNPLKEYTKMRPGDVVQVCELRSIRTVTGYLTDGSTFANELEPEDFEISIPVTYPEHLKVLHDMKNYTLVSEIYKDLPRFVRARESLVVPQGASLVTFEKDTVLEVLLRLQGAVRAFNQRGVDKLRVRYQQEGRDMEADIPVNTRAMFRCEPDATRYTIAEAISRYSLPAVVAFETNFLEKLLADRFPELKNKGLPVPDTMTLAKVETQEVLTICSLSTARGQSRYFIIPKKNFSQVKVRIHKGDEDPSIPCQYPPFADDSGYGDVMDTPWLVCLADDEIYEPVRPNRDNDREFTKEQPDAEVKQGTSVPDKTVIPDKHKHGGLSSRLNMPSKLKRILSWSHSENHVAPPRENKKTVVYEQSKSVEGYSSTEAEECGNYVEIDPETITPSPDTTGWTLSHKLSNSEEGNASTESDDSDNYVEIDPETITPSPDTTAWTLSHKLSNSEEGNASTESDDSDNYVEIDSGTTTHSPDSTTWTISNEPLNSEEGNSPTGSGDINSYVEFDQKTSIAPSERHLRTTSHEPSKSGKRNESTRSDNYDNYTVFDKHFKNCSEKKEEEMESGSYVTMKNTGETKEFDKLDVHEVCERLHTCGLGKLAKVAKTNFFDGHDFSKIKQDELKNEPFMLTNFEIIKLERVKHNWVPNM